jgi:5,10-methylenetetrahydromethanopterin reductase
MRIGIGVNLSGDIKQVIDRIAQAEKDGFAAAWMSHIFSYDSIIALSLAGPATNRIELGTFVVPTYPRHPAALAQQALTAQAATNNRFILGIGLSHQIVIEGMLGLDYSKPIKHSREYLSVLNPLLRQERAEFKGDLYRVAVQLSVPGAQPPPVLIAALGPQMLKLAGRLADGIAVWMGGPKYLEQTAIPTLTASAKEAGRPAPRIAAGFPIAVTSSVDEARETAAKTFAMYGTLPSYRAILDIEGVDPAGVAIVGDEGHVERELRRLAEIGVTDLNASAFNVRSDPDVQPRTMELLKGLAKSGV